jgi:uncharacterized protein YciW
VDSSALVHASISRSLLAAARRGSKRLRDKTDVVQLLEEYPELATEEVLAQLKSLRL